MSVLQKLTEGIISRDLSKEGSAILDSFSVDPHIENEVDRLLVQYKIYHRTEAIFQLL